MRYPTPPEPATPAALPIPGETVFYPAMPRGTFGSVRAALAAIGCTGAAAELQRANARAEDSDYIAVPVTVSTAPSDAGECVALVKRKPGGRAELLLGLIGVARSDEAEAQCLAREVSGQIGGAAVYVIAWTRQRRAVQ
ncbi:MAG: hypothetical protein JNL87_20300 [Burkholderiaceae bacterium]|nr:hypothetical protein [Burkholderiaceae bacterium]